MVDAPSAVKRRWVARVGRAWWRRGAAFEFGVGAGPNLEPSESLAGNAERVRQDGDGDACAQSGLAQCSPDGAFGFGVHERFVDLVRSLPFQVADDVTVVADCYFAGRARGGWTSS